jgi:hypothetical protein
MVPPFYHLSPYSIHSLDTSYECFYSLADLEKGKSKPHGLPNIVVRGSSLVVWGTKTIVGIGSFVRISSTNSQ